MHRVFVVPLPVWRREIQSLAERAERALEASLRSGPGENEELQVFSALLTEIEVRVRDLANKGVSHEHLLENLDVHVPLPWSPVIVEQTSTLLGLLPGRQMVYVIPARWGEMRNLQSGKFAPVEEAWRPKGDVTPTESAEQRWGDRLNKAASGGGEPLLPSDLNNRIMTMGLREYVASNGGRQRVDAPVLYKDGSQAAPFPLGAIEMKDCIPSGLKELRVALMSMRHQEMDIEVDACLLRNKDISIKRPAAVTDEVATQRSTRQLAAIAAWGPRLVRVYQTGLEPANVGFYRALTLWLAAGNKSLVIVPMYFIKGNKNEDDKFIEGRPWSPR